jgi:hypothetical protein
MKCSLCLEFASGEEAGRVLQSVSVDDEGFVRSRVEGSRLVAEIEAESVPSLLHTVDDYLACVTVAAGLVKKK